MAIANPGYMGWVELGTYNIRCTDFNLALRQDNLFYDHIIGLRDSIPSSILDAKGDVAAFNPQKMFWRAGVKIVDGSVSFPMSENSADAFLQEAIKGDDFDINLYYNCEKAQTFTGCKANTYSFSASPGDIATVSVGVMGKALSKTEPAYAENPTDAEKLITWDEIKVTGTEGDNSLAHIEFTINNNCIPIYTSGTNNTTVATDPKLSPKTIRVGMQQVTGTMVFWGKTGPTDTAIEDSVPKTITIDAGPFSATLTVLFQFPTLASEISSIMRTVTFVGVDTAIQ